MKPLEFLAGFAVTGAISLIVVAIFGDRHRGLKSFKWVPFNIALPFILGLVVSRPDYGDVVIAAYGVPAEFLVYGGLAGLMPLGQFLQSARPSGEGLLTIVTCLAATLYFGLATVVSRSPVPDMPETYRRDASFLGVPRPLRAARLQRVS